MDKQNDLTNDERIILDKWRMIRNQHQLHRKPCGLSVRIAGGVVSLFEERPIGNERITNGRNRTGN